MTTKELDRGLANDIRVCRRAAGLNQAELADALGYENEETVARHERCEAMPPLAIAISYEIVFRIPAAYLFAGLCQEMEARVEERLAQLEQELGKCSARDQNARATARKLMWLAERKNPEYRPRP